MATIRVLIVLRSWILQRISGTEGKTGGKEGENRHVH